MNKPFINTVLDSTPRLPPVVFPKTIDRVESIKFVRTITGLGLKESKDLCDANLGETATFSFDALAELVVNLSKHNLIKG